jgi:4-amino-4-deoxy-L-arabinose transferase-like glycosyltransferase
VTKGHRIHWLPFWTALTGLSLLVTCVAAAWHDFPVPTNDSVEYLTYARSVHIAGAYAVTEAGPAADEAPGREPLYSVVVAGLAKLHPSWSHALKDCARPIEACAQKLVFLKYTNAVFLALAAVVAGMVAQALAGSQLAAVVATSYISLNFAMWRDLKYVMSDYLALLLVAITVLCLFLALCRPTRIRYWIGLGFLMALLGLTKQVFLPFAILLGAGLLTFGLVKKAAWQGLLPGLGVLVVVALLNGGWLLRNLVYFGTMNDSRGSIALSLREVYDHMTAAEHATAFLWFARPPGPNLAKRWLPERYWHRFASMEPDGFYGAGYVNHAVRVERLKAHTGISDAVAQNQAGGIVVREMLANWAGYLLSMPAMFYRGLWFDAFMPLSLPLFILPLLWAWRDREWLMLITLSPALSSLLIYPAISLNIRRYQFTVVIALAVGAGLAAARMTRKPGLLKDGDSSAIEGLPHDGVLIR